MLILLPPSEGKSAPESGPVLDLDSLSFPALRAPRAKVITALTRLCRGDVGAAATTLGLGPTQRGEVAANARLRRAECAPAIEVYTGVLYEALDALSLPPGAQRRLASEVAISSALWGLLRPNDPIPSYRLSAGVCLPGVGPLAAAWRPPLTRVLASTEGLIVDLRSSAYAALGPVPVRERAVTIRVLTERAGRRTVVSHSNKHTKGLIVRDLMRSRRRPTDAESFADAVEACGYRVELAGAARGTSRTVDVILDAS